MQVRSTVQTREIDPQPRGPKGRLYPPLDNNFWFRLTCLMSHTGRECLSRRLACFSWDRAPPEVVVNAKDKQPGKTNECQQEDERKQYNELRQTSITRVKPLNSPGKTWKGHFISSLVSAVICYFQCARQCVGPHAHLSNKKKPLMHHPWFICHHRI